jgi:hypothetical protein
MITREDLAQMRLAAEMCDDYSQWKREMAEVRRLEAELDRLEGKTGAPTPKAAPVRPIPKRPSGGIRCNSIEEALAVLESRFGMKQQKQDLSAA